MPANHRACEAGSDSGRQPDSLHIFYGDCSQIRQLTASAGLAMVSKFTAKIRVQHNLVNSMSEPT